MTRVLKRETTSRYFGAQFEEGLRDNFSTAVGMCRRSWTGWFSDHGVPERPERPGWSSARFWGLTTHSAWNCSLPSLRRMLPWWARVCTCVHVYVHKYTYIYIYAPVRLYHACTSAVPRLGYKVEILRVPVVSCRPLGDRKVGACTGIFLSATYVVEELCCSSSLESALGCLAYLWVPWVTMLYVGTYVRAPR